MKYRKSRHSEKITPTIKPVLEKVSDYFTINDIGYVYILELENGVIKIGKTEDLYRRFKEHIRRYKTKIVNIYYTEPCTNYHELEKQIHRRLEPFKIKSEFFDILFSSAVIILNTLELKAEYVPIKQKYESKLKHLDTMIVELQDKRDSSSKRTLIKTKMKYMRAWSNFEKITRFMKERSLI